MLGGEGRKPFEGFTEDQLIDIGYAAGRAAVNLLSGLLLGLEDGLIGAAAPADVESVNDGGNDDEPCKTDIQDCRKCWCDTCARLEWCELHRAGVEPDGVRPLPCLGCWNGMRFMPVESARCDGYKAAMGFNNG